MPPRHSRTGTAPPLKAGRAVCCGRPRSAGVYVSTAHAEDPGTLVRLEFSGRTAGITISMQATSRGLPAILYYSVTCFYGAAGDHLAVGLNRDLHFN